jgi:hypothetical protein
MDVTLGTTAGGHLDAHPAAPKMSSVTLKPTSKDTGTGPVPGASMEAGSRHTSCGATCDVSGTLSVAFSASTAQVNKYVPHGNGRNKSPVFVCRVVRRADSRTGFTQSLQVSPWPR